MKRLKYTVPAEALHTGKTLTVDAYDPEVPKLLIQVHGEGSWRSYQIVHAPSGMLVCTHGTKKLKDAQQVCKAIAAVLNWNVDSYADIRAQWGNLKPDVRDALVKLCKAWEPDIDAFRRRNAGLKWCR